MGGVLVLALAALDFLTVARDFTMACACNSGAWSVYAIAAPHTRVTNKRLCDLRPGDMAVVVGRTGGPKNRVMRGVITRMRKEGYDTSRNGFRYGFDQNACVLIDAKGNPVGSKIRGPIDLRCKRRWPKIAALEIKK